MSDDSPEFTVNDHESKMASERISELANRYFLHRGDYLGQWVKPGRGWQKYFDDAVPPTSVSRQDVFSSVTALTNESKRMATTDFRSNKWRDIFLISMAWGHGAGYGAFRTNRVLQNMTDVNEWMRGLHLAVARNPEVGYQWLIENRVKGLGPAFATKLLYFVSPPVNRAPIIDALVANWLARNQVSAREFMIGTRHYDIEQYRRYLQFVDESLKKVAATHVNKVEASDRGFIEYLIFQDELLHRGKMKRVAHWITTPC